MKKIVMFSYYNIYCSSTNQLFVYKPSYGEKR